MTELALYLALLFGVPILGAVFVARFLRTRRPDWSRSKKAWIAALPIPTMLAVLAAWLIIASYSNSGKCRPEDVCDMPAMGIAAGIMILIASIVAYVIASIVAY